MKHLLYIIIGLAAVASLYFVYVNREQLPPNQRIQPSANITPDEWETKSDEQPPVTVMVTPIEFGKNIEVWKFDIAFDTHSGSLDDDLLKECERLTSAYIETRYPDMPDRKFTKLESADDIKSAAKILKWAKKQIL